MDIKDSVSRVQSHIVEFLVPNDHEQLKQI